VVGSRLTLDTLPYPTHPCTLRLMTNVAENSPQVRYTFLTVRLSILRSYSSP
jgi:hypothetical protein